MTVGYLRGRGSLVTPAGAGPRSQRLERWRDRERARKRERERRTGRERKRERERERKREEKGEKKRDGGEGRGGGVGGEGGRRMPRTRGGAGSYVQNPGAVGIPDPLNAGVLRERFQTSRLI